MSIPSKRFFPVIHCIDPFQQQGIGHMLRNIRIACENGADGVFLIGHAVGFASMLSLYENARKQFPELWIGINFLDVSGAEWKKLFSLVCNCHRLNALWMDGLPDQRLPANPFVEIFGGVAFKYNDPHLRGLKLVESCRVAKGRVDTITTSGSATGSPPELAKLEEIRRGIGSLARLALASGVNEENVSSFLPTVDTFLVASSITEVNKDLGSHEYFVPGKVLSLAAKIHG